MKTFSKFCSARCAGVLAGITLVSFANSLSGASSPGDFTFTHPREITNPWLPLSSLKKDVLEGREGSKSVRIERTPKRNLHKTFTIGGQRIDAFVLEDREFENGELAEVTLDYLAQADDGTVLYLGEDVDEYENGKVTSHEGAWLLGNDTQKPGIIVPGHPKKGDRFKSEDVNREIHEDDEIVSGSETVSVPAGTYKNCLKVKELQADGSVEYKYFAMGTGCVREVPADGNVVLKSHEVIASANVSTNAQPAMVSATAGANGDKVFQDPMARKALVFVGADPEAEAYWFDAIHDPSLPLSERQDLIDDLNEEGLPDPKHPTMEDVPLIMSRLELLEDLAPMMPKDLDWQECYGDLVNLVDVANGGGKPVD